MHTTSEMVIAVVTSVFASSGFWMFLMKVLEKKDALRRMVTGLGHDRIVFLCLKYIDDNGLTQDEFENLHDYLYCPYKDLGGNGSAKNLMEKVYKLPILPERRAVKPKRRIISKEEIK